MAEFVMKDLVKKQNEEENFRIASAAVSAEELGNDIYPQAKRKLTKEGIPFESRSAVQIKAADYEKYDRIVCMDRNNLQRAQQIFGGDPQNKLSLLLSFAGIDRDVADPWYTGDFNAAFEDILLGCRAIYGLHRLQGE